MIRLTFSMNGQRILSGLVDNTPAGNQLVQAMKQQAVDMMVRKATQLHGPKSGGAAEMTCYVEQADE